MKFNKLAAALLCFTAVSGISANAEISDVGYTPSSGVITVRGEIDANAEVFINVLFGQDGSFGERLAYQDVIKGSAEGGYSLNFRIDLPPETDDGDHLISIKENTEGETSEYMLALSDKTVLEGLKSAENKEEYMRVNRYALGLYLNGIDATTDIDSICAFMSEGDYERDCDDLAKTLQRYMLYDYIEKGELDDLFEFSGILELDQMSSMREVFTEDVFKAANRLDATSRMKGKNFESREEFEELLNEACVLAVVKAPDGYGNVKKVLDAFASEIGIDADEGSQKVYTGLQNNNYSSYEELRDAFNKLVETSGNTGGGGSGGSGGGGGAGGGSVSSSGGSGVPAYTPDGSYNKPESVAEAQSSSFMDMTGYDWASEAVEDLRAKGIVQGKADGIFAPQDSITRSEFVKMIVGAFAVGEIESDPGFSDLVPDRWDYKYICSAYGAGIVNGISDTYFGCSEPITRQDMAVMIDRIVESGGGELAPRFLDDRLITEYAYESVYDLRYNEVVNGDESDRFNPNSNATRAEAAVIIYRAMELM